MYSYDEPVYLISVVAKILEIRMVSTIKDAQDMYELLSE